jgi:hypothetical protein
MLALLLLGTALVLASAEGKTVQVLSSCRAPGATAPSGILKQVIADDGQGRQYLLELEGSHYQMGWAHGYLLAAQISDYYHGYFVGQYLPPQKAAQLDLPGILALLPRKYQEEVRGMAAGIARRSAELRQAGQPVVRPLTREQIVALQCEPELAGFACTSIASWGPRTARGPLAGATVVTRSCDWSDVHPGRIFSALQGTITFKSSRGSEHPIVCPSRAGILGVHTGMNGTGFFIEMNYAPIVPITARKFYPSVLYFRDALERVDGQNQTREQLAAQLAPILTDPNVIPTVQPMIAWIPQQANDPEGGVAVIEGIGTPAGPTYRTAGWNRTGQADASGATRMRLTWVAKQLPDGVAALATDGSFLAVVKEDSSRPGVLLLNDKFSGRPLFRIEPADVVAFEHDASRWVWAKATGLGGRFQGKQYRLENAQHGYYGTSDDFTRLIGLGNYPPSTAKGVCAFEVTTAGALGRHGYWISSGADDPACGVATLTTTQPAAAGAAPVEYGELRFAGNDADANWGKGRYTKLGEVAAFGEWLDESGNPAGAWYTLGRPDETGNLVNVNSWFLPETIRYLKGQDDCMGGLFGGYRMYRGFAHYGLKADYTLASHQQEMSHMYREAFGPGYDRLTPGGSISLSSWIPSRLELRLAYSFADPASGAGTAESPLTAYSAMAARTPAIDYVWSDFFQGMPAAAPTAATTAPAAQAAPAAQVAPQGTGGASNPTLGQP